MENDLEEDKEVEDLSPGMLGGLKDRKSLSAITFKDGKACTSKLRGSKHSTLHLMQLPREKMDFIDNEKNLLEGQNFLDNRIESGAEATNDLGFNSFDYKNPSPLMRTTSKKYEHIPIEEWLRQRDDLVDKANEDLFSNDIVLNEREEKCEKILIKLRQQMLTEDPVINTGHYPDKLPKLKSSKLYDALDRMPKPAHLHVHTTAGVNVDWLVQKLCYYDFVYLN